MAGEIFLIVGGISSIFLIIVFYFIIKNKNKKNVKVVFQKNNIIKSDIKPFRKMDKIPN